MPEDFEIEKFISANRAEVKDMCLTEYNETETMDLFRQEGRQEGWQEGWQGGWQEGWQEGRQEGWQEAMLLNIRNLMDSMGWTAEKTMDLLKIPHNLRDALYADLAANI